MYQPTQIGAAGINMPDYLQQRQPQQNQARPNGLQPLSAQSFGQGFNQPADGGQQQGIMGIVKKFCA